MIRTIPIDQLVPGMYVVDLHKGWLEHSAWRRRFRLRDVALVGRLMQDGVTQVSIETTKGFSPLPFGLNATAIPDGLSVSIPGVEREGALPPISLSEERRRALKLLQEVIATVQEIGDAVCSGQRVATARLEPLIMRMIASVARHPDALVPLAASKGRGAYFAEHAAASAALIIALARRQGLGEEETAALACGALIKDIGQCPLDAKLITHRAPLSQFQLAQVRAHVEMGLAILEDVNRLARSTVAVVREHHERFDGSGYPNRQAAEAISLAGRMAAIVDTYDAMTSERPYRRARSPGEALRWLYQGGGTLFDPELVAAFVHTVGVYPVGSLVRLESEHLGVVQELHRDDWLRPVVLVIFHAGKRCYVTPIQVDLACRPSHSFGKIVQAEAFESWGISPLRWQPA